MLMGCTAGQLFLGKSFGALDSEVPPEYVHDLDNFFVISGLEAVAPWFLRLAASIPNKGLQHFLSTRVRTLNVGPRPPRDASEYRLMRSSMVMLR